MACPHPMPKSALSKTFCMVLRNIFVHNGRGEMHFKNHKNGCLCVCGGREWIVCICLKNKNVINTEKKKTKPEATLLFLAPEEGEP